jgi:hypothetical protein
VLNRGSLASCLIFSKKKYIIKIRKNKHSNNKGMNAIEGLEEIKSKMQKVM